MATCKTCKGEFKDKGRIEGFSSFSECKHCSGSGVKKCGACNGKGYA